MNIPTNEEVRAKYGCSRVIYFGSCNGEHEFRLIWAMVVDPKACALRFFEEHQIQLQIPDRAMVDITIRSL